MSALPWFRLYHRMVDDEKLRLLAFEDRWHFVALCCLKADGLLDTPNTDLRGRKIAVKLGIQVRELEEVARRLSEVGLIDENLNPMKWEELQQRSDSSNDRVKRHREKKKKTNTLPACNGDVTAVKRPVNAIDKDIEEDKKEEAKASCATDVAPDLKPEHIFERWNETAATLGKPKVRDLTPERRQLLKARIAQYALDDFLTVFGKIEGSAFLRGDTGWRGCAFDWVFKKANFQKILEGNYDE